MLDHGVDRPGRAQELPLQGPAVDLELHGLRQVAFGDGIDDSGHAAEDSQKELGVDRPSLVRARAGRKG